MAELLDSWLFCILIQHGQALISGGVGQALPIKGEVFDLGFDAHLETGGFQPSVSEENNSCSQGF